MTGRNFFDVGRRSTGWLVVALVLAVSIFGSLATSAADSPRPAKTPPSAGGTPSPLDGGRPMRAALQLKDPAQINLLNFLSAADLSEWPSILKRNRSIINPEFINVMGMRGDDAYAMAVANRKNEAESRRYMEICFRYVMLADLCAEQLKQPSEYRLNLARKALGIGATDVGLAIVQNILVSDKDNIPARLLAGEIRMRAQDFFGAMQDYQVVVKKDPNNDKAWTNIGKAYIVVSDLPRATDALKRAVAANGNNREAKELLRRLENPSQIPAPGDLPTPNPGEVQTAEALAARGMTALQGGQLIESEKLFNDALRMSPTCAAAHMGLGDLAFRRSEFLKAIDSYNLASKYAPSNAEPLRYLALSLEKVFDQSGDVTYLDRAVEALKRAITLKSDYPAARSDQERVLAKKTRAMTKQQPQ